MKSSAKIIFLLLMATSLSVAEKINIAVLELKVNGVDKSDIAGLSNCLRTEMFKTRKYNVIERGEMNAILMEQEFQMTDCTSQECVVQVGQLLGVKSIVVGSIDKVGRTYSADIRLVDVETGQIQNAVNEHCKKCEIDDVLLVTIKDVVKNLVGSHVASSSRSGSAKTEAPEVQKPEVASKMVPIPEGCFDMGSEKGDPDERPVHAVCLDEFKMDAHEVTQADFKKITGRSPSHFKNCDNCPVENVSWFEARDFCVEVGKRLPTEAEWEYAARAGTTTEFYWGDLMSNDYAWNKNNSRPASAPEKQDTAVKKTSNKGWIGNLKGFDGLRGRKKSPKLIATTHPVGQLTPNEWGLYDMSGNVGEWVNDYYHHKTYKKSKGKNPLGPKRGKHRIFRGGSFPHDKEHLRSAQRRRLTPGTQYKNLGFRCVQ